MLIKIQTLGVHKGVKKVNEGGVALGNPNLCIFMDMSAAVEGLTRPCPLQDPGGDGSEPVTNKMGGQLGEDELLGCYTVMMSWVEGLLGGSKGRTHWYHSLGGRGCH